MRFFCPFAPSSAQKTTNQNKKNLAKTNIYYLKVILFEIKMTFRCLHHYNLLVIYTHRNETNQINKTIKQYHELFN